MADDIDRAALDRLVAGGEMMKAQQRQREVEALFQVLATDPATHGLNIRRLAERLHVRGVRAKEGA